MTHDLHDSANAPDPRTPAEAAAEGQDALETRFKAGLAQAAYYSAGRHWNDYAPAYRFGRDSRQRHAGSRFDAVERELEQGWDQARDQSRLGWIEARGAVEDGWDLAPDDDADEVDVALDTPGPKVG
ncbi:conserved hypothetical protein [Luteimonas sp. 9C]|uniref:hypothetical protein n=1 Tax=Luteimonas sp. 9C TaxID=2653148 RepID=UPI0012F43EF6|nr:hypothetical protein [Luteimonas sp. 9C]VXC21703.1 conserved hypothetical protein [Luteimonas sp. 9C]